MGFLEWASNNWFSLLQSLGIIGGLVFTGLALRLDARVRRESNELAVTEAHRELWSQYLRRPELARILEVKADVVVHPVTHVEEMFVLLLIVHLNTSLDVTSPDWNVGADEGLRQDIRWFFSLPIPRHVWEHSRARHAPALVRFVEACGN